MKDNPASTAHIRGEGYELLASRLLSERGYAVLVHDESCKHDSDIIVNGVSVEVKGSKPYSYNGTSHRLGFGFAIKRSTGNMIGCEIVLCLCVSDPIDVFVIPRVDLGNAHFIAIPNPNPSAYRGKWSKFLNRFDLLDQEINKENEENAKIKNTEPTKVPNFAQRN